MLLLDALLRRRVPVEPQLAVERDDGIEVNLDLGVPAARWGVELGTAIYLDRAGATGVPDARTGVAPHSGVVRHSGLVDSGA